MSAPRASVSQRPDSPGVNLFPPVIFLGCLLAGVGLGFGCIGRLPVAAAGRLYAGLPWRLPASPLWAGVAGNSENSD